MGRPRAMGFGFVGLLGALIASEALGLRVNLSASMPVGLYRLVACGEGVASTLHPGDLAAIDTGLAARSNDKLRFFRERGYLTFTGSPRDFLLKEVAALGGDVIEDVDGRLVIGARALSAVASFRSEAVRGEVLPLMSFPYRVPPGELWLSSDHRQGIDSRYFGAVSRDAVACRAEALWTR